MKGREVMIMMMSRSQDHDHPSSWQEKAFAEDAAGAGAGGCIWPPRCYSCSFCKREFRCAQALGGHMNVHRRDRARLKQHHSLSLQQNHHRSLSFSRVAAQESQSQQHHIMMSPFSYNFSVSESEFENKSKREERPTCLISSHEVETDLHSKRTSRACKRHKRGSSNGVSGFSYDHHIQYSEVIPAAAAVEAIDLELRL